jgi:peptide-methionine (S)-S-oxide reductase
MPVMIKIGLITAIAVAIGCSVASSSSTPDIDVKQFAPAEVEGSAAKDAQTAVFAGGCFWGVEGVFEHVKGVTDVKSGYAGGDAKTAEYDQVSGGATGHAESVKVTFDPSKVSYVQLLTIFFSVAHDPTELNRQGPDVGPQYRSAIFYMNDEQKKLAKDYIDAINKSKVLPKPIVTQVVALDKFYEAEEYHQDFMVKNPKHAYIVYNDLPKIEALKEKFPELYVEKK